MSKRKRPKRPADLEARDAQVLALPADLQIQGDFRVPKGSSRGAPRRRDTDGGFVFKGCKKGGRKTSYTWGGLAATAEHVNKQLISPVDAAVRGVVKVFKKTSLAFEN